MSGKRAFDEQLAALEKVRKLPAEECLAPLRKALQHRNNFVVGKAADMTRTLELAQLVPDLLAAFGRFFDDPVKNDPQCWAKNAIVRALADLGHKDADTYLRGLRFIQLEPVWGGSSDTAATLRATCALALVQCRGLNDVELLQHLVDRMGDKEKIVRVEAVHAIEQAGTAASSLLLRQRAVAGKDEAEILGACYSGVLRLEGASAIPWVSQFLECGDDAAGEAALAIAATHTPRAFEILRRRMAKGGDPWFISVMLSAIALTRLEEAMEFLMDQVKKETPHAEAAIEAILRSAPSPTITKGLEELVTDNRRLARAFAAHRPASI